MAEAERFSVLLTKAQISALIVTISNVKIIDVHNCRIVALRDGLQELKDRERELAKISYD